VIELPRVRECHLSEVIQDFPEIQPFDTNQVAGGAALFLCVLGFEGRCLEMPTLLAENGFTATAVRYIEYSTNQADNESNRIPLLQQLKRISGDIQSIECDNALFTTELRELLQSLSSQNDIGQPRVVFDFTVAANRVLMPCLKVLLESNIELTILYSEAAIYHPTLAEYERDTSSWTDEEFLGIERGISNVAISEEYQGHHLDQLPDCVILFPSIKWKRSKTIISEVDPALITSPSNKVIWLLGEPHSEQDSWRIEAMRNVNSLDSTSSVHEVSSFNYRDSLRTLEQIYQDRGDFVRFTLAPMGSNMQTLGTALFCYLRPSVRVILATPEEYNALNYSEGCRARWAINFGLMQNVRNQLDRVGTLSIQ
jgi:hypothetical protein